MVLAGHGVPKALANANFSRIPEDIARQLLRIKPKPSVTPPTTSSSSAKLMYNGVLVDDNIIGKLLLYNLIQDILRSFSYIISSLTSSSPHLNSNINKFTFHLSQWGYNAFFCTFTQTIIAY